MRTVLFRRLVLLCVALTPGMGFLSGAAEPVQMPEKRHSAFYGLDQLQKIRANLQSMPNGRVLKQQSLDRAAYWLGLSDEEIWGLMFGPTIRRSWMVWSNGKCPACTNDVVMYQWVVNAQKHPWKVQCPHCSEFFPKNDFGAFYKSGLDKQGVFDPALADRQLLFNPEHPDAKDPLRLFGVDDGEGYVSGDKRWRFIGAYLVYGQFKQLVCEGMGALAQAWVLGGDTNAARKAGILLDRVADLYPGFSYAQQGYVYETMRHHGYVSVWHDACEETREMALAYDQVFEAIRHDPLLVEFLSQQARKHGLKNPKSRFAEIQENIETGILRDALESREKMHSNFPRQEVAYTTIVAVLGWPENRELVEKQIHPWIARATSVDGVTGEKGLAGYSSYTISGLALLLAEFSRADPDFITRILAGTPSLRKSWRFHVDTMCLDRFYPNSGDCGAFALPVNQYVGASFAKLTTPRLAPSMFTFFWQLFQATGDPAYVQVLYRENGDSLDGLPHDLAAHNPEAIREGIRKVIEAEGPRPVLGSVHKSGWHIGILRSGKGVNARALWMDYDAGGAHGHLDGMNIGLFAMGADLLPDFGYPPVQHGGWTTPQVAWYLSPAAHNTVLVDGLSQRAVAGQCTLWADGEQVHLMRASAPGLLDIQQFERTLGLLDVSDEQFYVVDIFRVRGGSQHTKLLHGPCAEVSLDGLALTNSEPAVATPFMRHFRVQRDASPGWRVDFKLPARETDTARPVMRYTDLTGGASAFAAEANVMPFKHDPPTGFWIPSLAVQRRAPQPLSSVFVSALEVFDGKPVIQQARCLEVRHQDGSCTNGCVALEISLANGKTEFFVTSAEADRSMPAHIDAAGKTMTFIGDTCHIRMVKQAVERAAVVRGGKVVRGAFRLETNKGEGLEESEFVLSQMP